MSTREQEPEKEIQTSTHGEESVGKKPRNREEENQSVREALRRIVPELVQRNISEKQPCPEPGQNENDIFEKLLYEFRLAQQIYAMRREKRAWLEGQEEQEKKSVFENTLELTPEGVSAIRWGGIMMYDIYDELCELFYAAVQDHPSVREKMGNLLDSLDVSREEDRMKIDCLTEIAKISGQQWIKAIFDIAEKESPDAWYILAFCQFYGLAGMGSCHAACMCLMRCKDHKDANRFGYDHNDSFFGIPLWVYENNNIRTLSNLLGIC